MSTHPCGLTATRRRERPLLCGDQDVHTRITKTDEEPGCFGEGCGVHGNSDALSRFFDWAMKYAFKWLNWRGGKRRSFSWARFSQILDSVHIERPRIAEMRRRRVFA